MKITIDLKPGVDPDVRVNGIQVPVNDRDLVVGFLEAQQKPESATPKDWLFAVCNAIQRMTNTNQALLKDDFRLVCLELTQPVKHDATN